MFLGWYFVRISNRFSSFFIIYFDIGWTYRSFYLTLFAIFYFLLSLIAEWVLFLGLISDFRFLSGVLHLGNIILVWWGERGLLTIVSSAGNLIGDILFFLLLLIIWGSSYFIFGFKHWLVFLDLRAIPLYFF